jgi:hypothetical protein
MSNKAKTRTLRAEIMERLQSPGQLRACVCGGLALFGYVAIYLPFSGEIAENAAQLKRAQQQLELARDIDALRTQYERLQKHRPDMADPNEWVQYVVEGIRGFPVKLVNLDSRPPLDLGPFKAVVMRIELEGDFAELHSFLNWLETRERLFSVDSVHIRPLRNAERKNALLMQLNVLGLMG